MSQGLETTGWTLKFMGIMSSPSLHAALITKPALHLLDRSLSSSPPLNALYIVSVIVGTSD